MKHEAFWISCAAAGATLTVIAGAATAALAQPRDVTIVGQRFDDEGLTKRVSYSDLNLAKSAGERTLGRRVRVAARYVCAPVDGGMTLSDKRIHSECLDFALDGAEPQVALAVRRAREIAATGTSSILPVAIAIVAPR